MRKHIIQPICSQFCDTIDNTINTQDVAMERLFKEPSYRSHFVMMLAYATWLVVVITICVVMAKTNRELVLSALAVATASALPWIIIANLRKYTVFNHRQAMAIYDAGTEGTRKAVQTWREMFDNTYGGPTGQCVKRANQLSAIQTRNMGCAKIFTSRS